MGLGSSRGKPKINIRETSLAAATKLLNRLLSGVGEMLPPGRPDTYLLILVWGWMMET